MVQFYHMHAKLATTPTAKCGTVGTVQRHSSRSSLPGFTQANEVSCAVRPGVTTPETACKCIHDLPAPMARETCRPSPSACNKAQDCEKEDCRKEKAQDPSLNL